MSRLEFLDNFRVARNLFVHSRDAADAQHGDPQAAARTLSRSAVWLTPSSVRGFSPTDFAELDPVKRQELDEAVREFESVARQVSPASPATEAQLQSASTAFEKIVHILEPYLPTLEEAVRTHDVIQTVKFPEPIVNWNYELGDGAYGDPLVWVTVFADEKTSAGHNFGRLISDLTSRIRTAFLSSGIKRWPQIRIRTVAEHMATAVAIIHAEANGYVVLSENTFATWATIHASTEVDGFLTDLLFQSIRRR